MASDHDLSTLYMQRALELAARGQGLVEPNPMVGCVIVDAAGYVVGEGYHTRYGAAHAEIEALRIAGSRARGATMYVTLEPCCHQGQTGPCTQAVIAAGVARVVAAMEDPFPQVAGRGIQQLTDAGIEVSVGMHEELARALNAPFIKLVTKGRPWIVAKWAMTLDGKIATRTKESQWISSKATAPVVHALRGRMDAILVGRGTAEVDDPMLTARPPGPRVATRIVLDSKASLRSNSQLVQTAREVPVLVATTSVASSDDRQRLEAAGCEVFLCAGEQRTSQLDSLLAELGRRRMTNVLVEGGAEVLGSLFDLAAIDEVHAMIAPKLFGGAGAPSPIAGLGVGPILDARELSGVEFEQIGGNLYLRGRLK